MAKSDYRVAVGWNVNFSSLQPFIPQPRSLGVRYTRRNYLGYNNVTDDGPYIELLWSALDDDAMYRNILNQLSLVDTAPTSNVTLWARDEYWVYHRYNGMAITPQIGVDVDWNFMPINMVVLIKGLVKLS